ncbi:hypothetical protein [Nocardioides flavescens]|uniref:Uncharacterized protein n=1 Tax=Nocardioides flavescens TaxID=2691959 RepID=A0A6L7ER00_9ACTN|nr:hypothetical protein [Nocardioides flavescens]MXG89070.1 hypothetical protein [Nocardioides flavescens]
MRPLTRRSLVRGAALAAPAATVLTDAPARALSRGCAPAADVPRLLAQDMRGRHAGLMHGVPLSYNWAHGPRVGQGSHPGPFHAISAWGQVYEAADGSPATNVRVACREISVWLLMRSGRWRRVNASRAVNGANYVEDFSGNASKPTDLRTEPGGAVSATLGGGWNFHLYSTRARAVIDPAQVEGVVSLFSAKVVMDDPSGPDQRHLARWLASAGADYWLDSTVAPAPGTVADAGIGKARWVTPQWRTFTMSTLSRRRLERSAPPVCLLGR